jgi:tetratricopeptide (TPR) repeat protein
MRKHILWIVILTSLVYINTLYGNFVYDDYLVIVDNGFIKSAKNLALLFSRRYLTHPLEAGFNVAAYNIGSGEGSYRPVATLSYFLNYAVFKLDPFGYRLTNIVIHILCAILIYMLLKLIFAKTRLALFASLLFGIHPVNAEVINCTAFRPNSLALLFCLLAIILYFKFKARANKTRYFYLGASLFSAFLAVFSKETAVILPLALILCEYYQLKFDPIPLLKSFKIYFLYFLVDAIYIFVYFVMLPPTQTIFNAPDISTNLVRMFDVLGIYLKGLTFPVDLLLIDPTEIFRSSFTLLLGISAFVLAAYVLVKKNKLPKEISFGVIWFFIWILPMNNFLNSFRILAAFRYLYLPMLGFAVLAGLILDRIWQAHSKIPVLHRVAPFACFSYFAIFTISTNAGWKDDMILNTSMVEKNPESIYAHINLGSTLLKYDNIPEAKNELLFVLDKPMPVKSSQLEFSLAYSNLGSIYMSEGNYLKAEEMYRKALELTPHVAHIYTKLGFCFTQQGLYNKALDYFNQAKKINPYFAPAYLDAGITYLRMGKYSEAKLEFNQALKIKPDYSQAKDNLNWLERLEKGQ